MNRKELKDKYKQTIQPMGIYQVRNTVTGKIFIGSSKNLEGMLNRNKFQLQNDLHMNKELQRDFNEVGEESFSFEVLDKLKPQEVIEVDYTEELNICLLYTSPSPRDRTRS